MLATFSVMVKKIFVVKKIEKNGIKYLFYQFYFLLKLYLKNSYIKNKFKKHNFW